MALLQSTTVFSWKDRLLGKPCFKPYHLYLYGNGRILLEKQDSDQSKGSANLCDIFPYIRIGTLNSEKKIDRATDENLTLAYYTLIIPLEKINTMSTNTKWREREFAFGFDREIKEWMASFAQVLSFQEQFDEVVRKYSEKKKYREFNSSAGGSLVQQTSGEDPARLWSTARNSGDDYVEIWSLFLDHCSARIADGQSINGPGNSFTKCLRGALHS